MRFKSFAFSLSTMLALKSFITSVPVAQYCEFCILQLWLHNKMNRTHCSLTLTNTCALYCVASDSNDPVWTSLIFFKDKCCVSPSVQSVGTIIVLNSWNGKVSSSYLLPPLPKRGKKKIPTTVRWEEMHTGSRHIFSAEESSFGYFLACVQKARAWKT